MGLFSIAHLDRLKIYNCREEVRATARSPPYPSLGAGGIPPRVLPGSGRRLSRRAGSTRRPKTCAEPSAIFSPGRGGGTWAAKDKTGCDAFSYKLWALGGLAPATRLLLRRPDLGMLKTARARRSCPCILATMSLTWDTPKTLECGRLFPRPAPVSLGLCVSRRQATPDQPFVPLPVLQARLGLRHLTVGCT